MRILVIVDCYLPSTKSSAKLIHDLALELERTNHDVTVLAPSDDLLQAFAVSYEDGVRVARVRTKRIKGASRILRALRERALSDVMWRCGRSFFETHPHDAIIFYSPSIFFGKLVRRLKRLWRCRAYLIVRDLFPQWALDAGLIRRGPTYYFFKYMELVQYAVADVVGVQSPANLSYFDSAPIRPRKLEVLYNWARVACAAENPPLPTQGTSRSDSIPKDGIVFFFGGNMGVAQDMDAIVRLAETLRERADIRFILVGDGSETSRLRDEIRRRGLPNVVVLPAVSQGDYRAMLAQADVGLISLNPRLTTHNIPGKLLGYLASGIPVLSSLNRGNDLAQLITEAGAGISCEAGDDTALRNAALELVASSQLRRAFGENGKKLLADKFSAEAAARQIVSHFDRGCSI